MHSETGGGDEARTAILLNGSAGVAKTAWFANKAGKVAVLRIDGKKVTKVKEIEVGGLHAGPRALSAPRFLDPGAASVKR